MGLASAAKRNRPGDVAPLQTRSLFGGHSSAKQIAGHRRYDSDPLSQNHSDDERPIFLRDMLMDRRSGETSQWRSLGHQQGPRSGRPGTPPPLFSIAGRPASLPIILRSPF